jgi:copper transport protein
MSPAGRVSRWLAAGIVVAVIVLGSGRPVSAHASLLTTNPAADSVLDIPPGEIVLRFTEPVDPTDESIRLVTADGTPVELGSVTEDRGSASLSAAITGELDDGSYVVAWSAVSADSHPISGAFVFSVGAPSQDAEALIGDVLGDTSAESGSDFLLSAGRFASYAGIAALTGTLAAAVIVAPSTLNRRRLSTVLFAAGDLAMVGTLAMICAQANLIGASFVDWSAVFSTRSGQWWLARLVIVAVITALVPWRRLLDRRPAQVLAAVTSLVLFAVVAAGGHSVSGRWTGVAFTATVVHLAAMALWLGGLVLIVVVVDKSSVFSTAWRFSPLALSAVTLLAVTGFFNGWRQLGDLDSLSDSSYGRWLLIKLALVGVVVTVAAASRWIIRNAATPVVTVQPASVGAAAATSPSNDELPLRRTLVIEVAGMVVILTATAGLTGATPPQQADATTAINATVSVVSDDQLAQIELLPAVTGGTTMHVTISSPAGSLNPADEITVTAELPAQQLGPVDIPTFPAGPNHVTTNDANFPIPGQWTVTVTARYGEFDQIVFTTDVAITNP